MSEWVEQVAKVENALSREQGEFDLFALFLREDAPGKWDLLIAAPWAEKDKASALKSVRVPEILTTSFPEILTT